MSPRREKEKRRRRAVNAWGHVGLMFIAVKILFILIYVG